MIQDGENNDHGFNLYCYMCIPDHDKSILLKKITKD